MSDSQQPDARAVVAALVEIVRDDLVEFSTYNDGPDEYTCRYCRARVAVKWRDGSRERGRERAKAALSHEPDCAGAVALLGAACLAAALPQATGEQPDCAGTLRQVREALRARDGEDIVALASLTFNRLFLMEQYADVRRARVAELERQLAAAEVAK